MKVLFIGTGAADWKIEKRQEGEFFRRLTGNMINDDLMIDPGPHIYDYMEKENCPNLLDNVKNVLVSHSHGDHFSKETLRRLLAHHPVHVWCNERTAEYVKELTEDYTVVHKGEEHVVGNYVVRPVNANHSPLASGEQPLMYVIESEGKRVFYTPDTAWLPTDTWYAIRKMRFDCMMLEVTLGDVVGDYRIFEHNTIPMMELMLQTFRKSGLVDENTVLVATHLSKHAHLDHEATSKRFAELGMLTAYDGFSVEF